MSWTPPKRPTWVERLIEHGEAAGGAENLVSLEAESLLQAARRATGLADFGEGDWRTHFDVLVRSLEEESKLHLVGRTIVRTELVLALGNRLGLADLWKRRPEILDEPVDAPVFIVGSPRSGTSILHELMACDPASRCPAMWEMQRPIDAIEGRDRGQSIDHLVRFWHDVQPEYETMHENSGFLPNECIYLTLPEFLSVHWSGNHVVPSYERHLQATDERDAYRYHRRFLQSLQSGGGSRRWLLKAPSHLFTLPELLDVYPDARIIRTHRDPLKTLPSAISLMGTIKWIRCREVDMSAAASLVPAGYAYIFQKEIEGRQSGALPDDRFIDVHFDDVVRDPVGTVGAVYQRLGWEYTAEARERVGSYAEAKPKGSRGVHRYSLSEVGLDATTERERFAFYTRHFGVREESSAVA